MTPIRTYTTIEQSRKVAEILQTNNADLKWFFWKEEIDAPKPPTFGYSKTAAESYKDTEAVYLPCWSLAVLIEILPKEYTNSKNQVCSLHIDIVDSETPYLIWYANPEHEGSIVEIKTKEYSNLIDACYEMVLNLNELNLL